MFKEPVSVGKIRFVNGGGAPDLGVCRLLVREDEIPAFQGVLQRGEVEFEWKAECLGKGNGRVSAGKRGFPAARAVPAATPRVVALPAQSAESEQPEQSKQSKQS